MFVLIIFYQATEPLSVPIPNRLNHLYIVCGYPFIESQNTQNLGIYRILGSSQFSQYLFTNILSNVEFQLVDINETRGSPEFDVVYLRFLLTHLSDPQATLSKVKALLRFGGLLVIEDIDFTGYFCYPEFPAFRRYVELYTEAVRCKGGDANIGARLPVMMLNAGFDQVEMNVVQPMGLSGETKLINPITMENIAASVIALELASPDEVKRIIAEMYEFADNPRTVAGLPRIIQTWGYEQEFNAHSKTI